MHLDSDICKTKNFESIFNDEHFSHFFLLINSEQYFFFYNSIFSFIFTFFFFNMSICQIKGYI